MRVWPRVRHDVRRMSTSSDKPACSPHDNLYEPRSPASLTPIRFLFMPQSRPPRPPSASAASLYSRSKPAGTASRPPRADATARKPARAGARPAFVPAARPSRPSTAHAATPRKARPKAAAAPARGPLTPSQKRYLRGLAHALKPVILVGQKGVTAAVLNELDAALEHHELVKVKLADGDRESRAASIERIRTESNAELVQTIGHVACFFRSHPDESAFTLPR